jgi:hypothetical protein
MAKRIKRPQTKGLDKCPEEKMLRKQAAALAHDIDREILKKILKDNADGNILYTEDEI